MNKSQKILNMFEDRASTAKAVDKLVGKTSKDWVKELKKLGLKFEALGSPKSIADAGMGPAGKTVAYFSLGINLTVEIITDHDFREQNVRGGPNRISLGGKLLKARYTFMPYHDNTSWLRPPLELKSLKDALRTIGEKGAIDE